MQFSNTGRLNGLAIAALLLPTLSSAADPASVSFDIPAQALSGALTRFSAATGLQVLYDGDLTQNINAPALKGDYSAEQALRKLLQGSGLNYRFSNGNTVTLEKAARVAPQSANTMPAVTVTGKAPDSLSGLYSENYTVTNAFTATKTDAPLMETPMSIQVIPKMVMADQKATRITEALENVSGVRPQSSLGLGNMFIVRGFRSDRIYRNGLLASGVSIGAATEYDTSNLQQIEVLKGPAAVLFGRVEPGGLINIVTKRPEQTSRYSVEQRFGSYDFYRTEWDATGALTDDSSLSYRFAGSYQNNESFREFNQNDRVLIHPSLTWRISDATEVSVDVEGLYQEHRSDRGLFAIGDRPAPIPVSRSFIDPNDPLDSTSKVNVGFNLTHAFNDKWTLRNRFLASFNDSNDFSIKPANAFTVAQFLDPNTTNRTYLRNIFHQLVDAETYTTNLDLTGNFELGDIHHQTLIGFDYLQATGDYWSFGNFRTPVPGLEIDIYNPRYGIDPSFFAAADAEPSTVGSNYSYFKDEWYGVYFQDHITLWDSLHILGGGRYDWATSGRGRGDSFDAARADLPVRRDEGFSPRVGLLYQPWDELSVYGNWTTSFGANNGLTATGESVDPEIGEQFEAGLKAELFDHRLSATAAYYHLTKQNVLTRDINSPIPNAVAPIGEARSQGIELDVSGQITDELSLIGNYAFTDARIIKDNNGRRGNRMSNVPEHSGSLWLKYDVKNYQPLEGWSFGIGMFAAGKREGDDENTFILPGYVRLDAFTAYSHRIGDKRLIAQFNIRNLLDKTYYNSTDPFSNAPPRVGIYPGEPLTAMGSIRLEF
ncbi:TonB-dependent siderophore receptor [Methylomonas rivi]|uniref:TonB-dependent receptor n=1 Tax=Methylomonas rivi TaxID=2952226 RepID=A0ABT1U9U8_9GAMM|nr:TonB-dependent receptor [Methylomonas sp. WSC-6]MCQ8130636.1 TonB-dependent receptor [Methylomonas sp. WSC-6]